MSVLGLVLDPRDVEMYARNDATQRDSNATQRTTKKARLMKRLLCRAPEVFQKALWKAEDNAEYQRNMSSKVIRVALPQVTTPPKKKPATVVTSPPRRALASPKPAPVTPPPVRAPSPSRPALASTPTEATTELTPRESCESPEVEMYTSPPKVRVASSEPQLTGPLVIPSSPIEGGEPMEESPFNPKRSRTPPPMHAPPVNPPAVMQHQPGPVPVAPLPAFGARPDAQQPVAGRRRLLKASRSRRQEEPTDHGVAAMDEGGMQTTPTFLQSSLSGSSFDGSPSSFTNTASPNSFFGTPSTSTFGAPTPIPSFSGSSSFFETSPHQPVDAQMGIEVDQPMDQGFQQPMSGFGTAPTQRVQFGGAPMTGFQQQQPTMQQQSSPAMMPSGGVATFALGRQSTPPAQRGRARGRRKPRTSN